MEFRNSAVTAPLSFDNNWHQFVGVYGGGAISTTNDSIYVDGVRLAASLIGSGTPSITTTQLKIGGIPTVTGCCAFNGSVDEVRVRAGTLSADWIATEYANQSSPSSFYSVGSPTGGPTNSLGSLICVPSALYVGGNTTCSVKMQPPATAQMTFTLDGQAVATVSPDSNALFQTVISFASSSIGSHAIAYTYAGDATHPPATGNTGVSVQQPGTSLPNQNTVYSYSIIQSGGVNSGYAANGNIEAYTDSVNGQWSMTNGYDSLNRLVTASQTPVTGPQQSFCMNYDSFGNRLTQATSGSAFGGAPGADCTTRATGAITTNAWAHYDLLPNSTPDSNPRNRVTSTSNSPAEGSIQYDDSGNMAYDGQNHYLYDGEGRICAVNNAGVLTGYLYNAEGQRVAKGSLKTFSCDLSPDPNGSGIPANWSNLLNEYLQGPDGQDITEFDGQGTWLRTDVSAQGKHVATYRNDGQGVHFHLADWLGTRRVQTDSQGYPEVRCQSLPFGDGQICTGVTQSTADASDRHFTGKERDRESGLDYFGARYYGSSMGRFMSPDPSGLYFADPFNPQSLNLYSYALNNPLKLVDPSGLVACDYGSSDFGGEDYEDADNAKECTENGGTLVEVNATVTVNADGSSSDLITMDGQNSSTLIDKGSTNRPLLDCASSGAGKVSIAGGLNAVGIGNNGGVGGFVTDALGGNAVSSAIDLVRSFGSGSAGGHSVFYNMGQSVVSGPMQGIPASGALEHLAETPFGRSASGIASDAIAVGIHTGIAAGGKLTTLSGTVSTAALTGTEYATGIAWIKLGYDAVTYTGAILGCAAGIIH